MKKYKHGLVLSLLTITFVSGNATGQGDLEDIHTKIDRDLDQSARLVAELLSDSDARAYVRDQLLLSDKRENIVEYDALVEGMAREKKFSNKHARLDKESRNHDATKKNLSYVLAKKFRAGFDIYFPVKEHLEIWDGSENLYVACVPFMDEKEVTEIVAYSVRDGSRISLDPNITPDVPVLVVSVEEHVNHDKHAMIESITLDDHEHSLEHNLAHGSYLRAASTDKCADADNLCYFGAAHFRVNQWMESAVEKWFGGNMEIYVLYAQATSAGSAYTNRINLTKVDKDGKWYVYNNTPSGIGTYFAYRNDYSDITRWEFWEEDTGTEVNVDVKVPFTWNGAKIADVGVTLTHKSNDDFLGRREVFIDEVGDIGLVTRSVGGMDFCIDRDRNDGEVDSYSGHGAF